MHSTRAKPMSISRAVRNGNASLDNSTRRERLEQLTRSRALHVELGVARGDVGDEGVLLARSVAASSVSTWRCAVSVATTQKRSSPSFVTVRSAWSLPASLSHCV